MFKVYGSAMCPDCVWLKLNFDTYGIEYEFIDILDSLKNLKEFLKLRDNLEVFDRLKKIGDIGLPAVVRENGEVFVAWEKYITDELGLKLLELEDKKSCSIDGKGC